ncbi:hypothetical protein MMC25_007995 [Agyrium rufum]|nr:hypothetical protein [Agyrium rufum]
MDPLSSGASVLAFLGLALKSAKAIHYVLSTVKDGPSFVQSLVDKVAQLQSVLERKCIADITGFESKLLGLKIGDGSRRRDKLWKRLKAVFSEQDLELMRDVVRAHMVTLNVWLGLVHTTQLSCSTTQSSEILMLLKQLKNDVAGLQVPSVPTSIGITSSQDVGTMTSEDDTQQAQNTDNSLEESITRLIKLVEQKECTVKSDDAEQFIRNLEILLESAQQSESNSTPSQPPIELHEGRNKGISLNLYTELKLATNWILSAPSIVINSEGQSAVPAKLMSSLLGGAILDQQ